MANDLMIVSELCELDKTSLTFKRDVNKEEWLRVFRSLKTVEGCVQFWIGDALAYRQQKWGMYDDAGDTGYEKKTIENIISISQKVESSRRREDLRFSHHAEVAALPPEKQEIFLQKAVDEELSVRELREEIRRDFVEYQSAVELPQGIYQYGLPADWHFWERLDQEMLDICRVLVVLCLDGWGDSEGIKNEIDIAARKDRPIIYHRGTADNLIEQIAQRSGKLRGD